MDNSWKRDYQEAMRLANGSRDDKQLLFDWLLARVVNGEELNYGYRKMLEHVKLELEGV